jgi:hypothetical protein
MIKGPEKNASRKMYSVKALENSPALQRWDYKSAGDIVP